MSQSNAQGQDGPPLAARSGSEISEWPARDIVRKLIEAADLLLDHCDYDGDGWEEIHLARSLAHSWAESPNAVALTDRHVQPRGEKSP